MGRGGHAASGRVPDPDALRRDRKDDAAWTTLIGPREGEPPEWPFEEMLPMETRLWAREWRRPQAVMWERNGQVEEVALYVRSLVAAQAPDAKTPARALVRQQQEALGISLPGLMRNRWRIAEAREEQEASTAPTRSRFKVVAGGVGA